MADPKAASPAEDHRSRVESGAGSNKPGSPGFPALIRRLLSGQHELSAVTVLVLTVLYLALTQNLSFAQAVSASLPHPFGALEWRISISVAITLVNLLMLVLLPFSAPRVLKPMLASLLLVAAVCSYFMDTYRVVIDESMIVNVFRTDVKEAGDLLRSAFWSHLLLVGALPAFLLLRIRIRKESLLALLQQRALLFVGVLLLQAAILLPQYNALSFWGREQRHVRLLVNPTYPIYSVWRYAKSQIPSGPPKPLRQVAADGVRKSSRDARPFLVVLAVGETARAQNFQLNGYARETNPRLSAIADLINFSEVHSCGTATAESVPCMFSNLARAGFSRQRAAEQENILDVLQKFGVAVQWWENDSGCQGVCQRVPERRLDHSGDAAYCADGSCRDEILLRDLDQAIPTERGQSNLLVLHMQGSHGPAYYRRYPDSARKFLPDCRDPNVQRCAREEVVNAYDNTLVYTDYVLAELIETLRMQESRLDSVVIYVSDHGESLGENGLYLHGLPYALAPKEQTRVPMVAWFSAGARSSLALDMQCLRSRAKQASSHENLFHSLLGLFSVSTRSYKAEQDLFSACRISMATGNDKTVSRPSTP